MASRRGTRRTLLSPPQLGPNLVINGGFDTDTVWAKGVGWSIAGGVASSDGSQVADSDLSQNIAYTFGIIYQVKFTLSNYVAGTVRAVSGGTLGAFRSANGIYTENIQADVGIKIHIRANLDFIGDIDNVSVREVL